MRCGIVQNAADHHVKVELRLWDAGGIMQAVWRFKVGHGIFRADYCFIHLPRIAVQSEDFQLVVANAGHNLRLKKEQIGHADMVGVVGAEFFHLVFQVIPEYAEEPVLFLVVKIAQGGKGVAGAGFYFVVKAYGYKAVPGGVVRMGVVVAVEV